MFGKFITTVALERTTSNTRKTSGGPLCCLGVWGTLAVFAERKGYTRFGNT